VQVALAVAVRLKPSGIANTGYYRENNISVVFKGNFKRQEHFYLSHVA
jgi:hypothetical protein